MSIDSKFSNNWVGLSKEERQTILAYVADKKGIIDNAVEKDYWVSMVLKAIFRLPCSQGIVFKGGTSLSKSWNLIDRFSEDCDLAIDRSVLGYVNELNGTQRNKLRKTSKSFIDNRLVVELESSLNELGLYGHFKLENPPTEETNKDPVEFFVEYRSILPEKNPYISERVKVEISCRSLTEPFESVSMRSMIEDEYPDESFSQSAFLVPTVLPGKTFLEKIFLLHEEFIRPGGGANIDRLSRHLYDLEKMMDKDFAIEALKNEKMYSDIVEHRSKYTAWSGIDYKSHHPSTISFLPDSLMTEMLKEDYKKLQEGFIYGSSLSFERLIERISILQERIRGIACDTPFFQ